MNERKQEPRYGFNRAGMPVYELRTHVVEAAIFDRLDEAGRPRFKAAKTIVRVVRF